MPRVMLDTDVLSALDGSFELLATYSDLVANAAELEKQYPDSKVLYIDRGLGDPGDKATIGDFESGALSIADVHAWLTDRHARKLPFITAYSDRNDMQAITEAAKGLAFWRWIATLDGTAFIEGYRALHGPAAIQILPSQKLNYHADISIAFEAQWNPTRPMHNRVALRRDLNGAISELAKAQSDLHRMATLI